MRILLLLASLATFSLHAQVQSPPEFGRRLSVCEAQADRPRRTQCFEVLARDSVAELEGQRRRPGAVASPPQSHAGGEKQRGSKYGEFIALAKAKITDEFKDPSSVQWRNVVVSTRDGGSLALCGELNGKNSYGAYVGFRRFFATQSTLASATDIEDPENGFRVPGFWESFCGRPVESVE